MLRDLTIVLAIAFIAIVLRTGEISLQGEETRRGEFAVEMLRSGDWVAMTQQGLPFIDRPPAQYWAIAASFGVAGGVEPGVNAGVNRWALRAPGLISTLLTVLLVWGFARRQFGELAALTAGIAYSTMAIVIELGGQAETEAQFVLFVSASLLIWLDLYQSGKPPWLHFLAGYALCGIAALTKGTQAPVAFMGMLLLVLSMRRDWRTLFSSWHLAGLAAFVAIVAVWQIPSFRQSGWTGFWGAWFLEASNRTDGGIGFVEHFLWFPFELLGQLMPWGIALLLFALPMFRRTFQGEPKMRAWSLLLASLPILIPVWLVTSARVRYAMPAVPIAAILVGIALVQSVEFVESPVLAKIVTWALRILMVTMTLGVVALFIISVMAGSISFTIWPDLVIPMWIAGLQLVIGIVALIVVFGSSGHLDEASLRRSVIAGGVFIAVVSAATVTGIKINRTRNVEELVMQARASVPGQELVSFTPIYHQFVFNWPRPIPIVPAGEPVVNATWRYFVINRPEGEGDMNKVLPFNWREVTRIELDRNRNKTDGAAVIIGERFE